LQGSRIHSVKYQGVNYFRRKLNKVAFECHNLISWKLVLHFFCTLISSAEITSHLCQWFSQFLTFLALLLHPNSNIPRPLSFSSTSIHTYSLIWGQSLSLKAHNHMNVVPLYFWFIQRTQVFATAKSSLQSKGSSI
jgi:hypothetical protein